MEPTPAGRRPITPCFRKQANGQNSLFPFWPLPFQPTLRYLGKYLHDGRGTGADATVLENFFFVLSTILRHFFF